MVKCCRKISINEKVLLRFIIDVKLNEVVVNEILVISICIEIRETYSEVFIPINSLQNGITLRTISHYMRITAIIVSIIGFVSEMQFCRTFDEFRRLYGKVVIQFTKC